MTLFWAGIVGTAAHAAVTLIGLIGYIWFSGPARERSLMNGAVVAANFPITFIYALLIANVGVITRADGTEIWPILYLAWIPAMAITFWAYAKHFWVSEHLTKGAAYWGVMFSAALFGATVDPNQPTRWGIYVLALFGALLFVLILFTRKRVGMTLDWIMLFIAVGTIIAFALSWAFGPGFAGAGLNTLITIVWIQLIFTIIFVGLGLLLIGFWLYCCKPIQMRDKTCPRCNIRTPCNKCNRCRTFNNCPQCKKCISCSS